MKFDLGDFLVYTETKKEEFAEIIAVPTNLSSGKPSDYKWQKKTRDFTVFEKLYFLNESKEKFILVTTDIFEFIDLIEVLKAYSAKRLEDRKVYNLKRFEVKIVKKNDIPKLRISFANVERNILLDRFECSALAAKFSKILQRCESWQEQQL